MKKIIFPLLLLVADIAMGQTWEAEVQAGIAGYSGDLNSKPVSIHTMGAGFSLGTRYNLDRTFIVRANIAYGKIGGDDKYNKNSPELLARNLNFKTDIIEASIGLEVNMLSPELFDTYPYVFAGAGVFHFDPYSFDKDGKKVFLQPLGTEGQGLSAYPEKKMYSKTQLCIPFGVGVRSKINDQFDVGFEIGFRKLFTDYLDDVSGTYANPEILLTGRGAKAYEMAYRGTGTSVPHGGEIRGNPKKKDWYYFAGVKLIWKFNSEPQN